MAAVSAAAEHGRRARRRELEGQRGGGGVGGGKGPTGANISPLIQIIEKIFGRDVERRTVIWHTINLSCASTPCSLSLGFRAQEQSRIDQEPSRA